MCGFADFDELHASTARFGGVSTAPAAPEQIVYSNTFDGLKLALTTHGIGLSEVTARFKQIGVDFAKPLPAYTRQHYIDALKVAASMAYPGLPDEPAYRRVGALVIEGYVQTVLGRAVHAAARLMGPMWTLKRMTRNLRTSDTWTEVRVTELSPTDVTLVLNDHTGAFGYYEGLFEAIVVASGGVDAHCTLTSTAAPFIGHYRLIWARKPSR